MGLGSLLGIPSIPQRGLARRLPSLNSARLAGPDAFWPHPPEEVAALEQRRNELQERYGDPFLTSYGWAAQTLDNRRPTFVDIERSVDLGHWRPYYYLANLNVHGEARANRFRLGVPDGARLHLAGPSYLGLADPLHGATLSLLWLTFAVLGIEPTMDVVVRQKILELMHEDIRDEVSLAHSRSVALYEERNNTGTLPDAG